MKVHIVTKANRAHYRSELEQMHRLRHEIFVDELGWSALRSDDGIERDEFDDDHAVYLIAAERGEVHGSVRLLPTWKRCMITERFPEWTSPQTIRTGAGIWEWTRWAPGTTHRPRSLIRARAALIVAALEFAESRGIDTYMTFCEAKFLPQLVELGWGPEPLGLPRAFAEGQAIAVRWAVLPHQLEAARAQFRLRGAVACEMPAFAGEHMTFSPSIFEQLTFLENADEREEIADRIRTRAPAPVGRRHTDLAALTVQGRA